MPSYSVTLTAAEIRALKHICLDPNDWIQHAFNHRVFTAMQGLSDLEIAKSIKAGEQIITDREKLVELSKEPAMSEWVITEEWIVNPDDPFQCPAVNINSNK
jgi:hypothetical protein